MNKYRYTIPPDVVRIIQLLASFITIVFTTAIIPPVITGSTPCNNLTQLTAPYKNILLTKRYEPSNRVF